MRHEDLLDAYLDTPERSRAQWAADRDLEPLLTAASRLGALRDAMPSQAFASDLEARLADSLAPRSAESPQPTIGRRIIEAIPLHSRITWAAIAAVLLLTVGLGAITAKAAPGAPLYGVRQFAQTLAARALPSPTVNPSALLAQERKDLSAYSFALARSDTPGALAALGALNVDDHHSAQAVAAMQDARARAAAQAQLSAFHSSAGDVLRTSLASLDWRARAQVTDVLRSWGATTLSVSTARIQADGSSGHDGSSSSGSALLIVHVSGSGFAPDARLLIDGVAVGELDSVTPTQLIAKVARSSVEAGSLVIGVENPDGTVALTNVVGRDDKGVGDSQGSPSDSGGSHGSSTDGSQATPTNDHSATPNAGH